jgi:uncharacterized protein YaaQ
MVSFSSPEELRSEGEEPKDGSLIESNRPRPPIQRLLAVVIQLQDMRKTLEVLDRMGLPVIHLASTGAFLGRRNVTLLVGMPADQIEAAMQVIRENCHQRVEYMSTPLEGAPMPIPIATPITVGGATVFTLDIDRFEEF